MEISHDDVFHSGVDCLFGTCERALCVADRVSAKKLEPRVQVAPLFSCTDPACRCNLLPFSYDIGSDGL